jgi:S1-C subfamily serine protease
MKTLLAHGFAVSIATLLLAGSAIADGATDTVTANAGAGASAPPHAAAPAPATPGPDRSQLSVEENVIINAACFPTRKQGDSAYERCVSTQIAALKDHPSPDRSSLSAERNQQLEYACATFQRRGIAAYNDCLTQQLASSAATATKPEDASLNPDLEEAVKQVAEEKPTPTPVAATTVGSSASALPKWVDHTEMKPLSGKDLFKRVSQSVYMILAASSAADFRAGQIALGSGVAVGEHLLLTNCHVVSDRPFIHIILDRTPVPATLVGADRQEDRCVIRAETITLSPVPGVRSFSDLAEGEAVFAIGTPMGLKHTLSEGVISGLRQSSKVNMVQTTAPISPGSSGGGLFDERGNLIGITALNSGGRVQNLNFAIAASDFWR